MNAQEVFDKVATHLLTQQQKSLGPEPEGGGGQCMYRGTNGLMCAVGCLIPDDAYYPVMEGAGAGWLLGGEDPWMQHPEMKALAQHSSMLGALQRLHDREEIQDWPEGLVQTAEIYGLQVPEIVLKALGEQG